MFLWHLYCSGNPCDPNGDFISAGLGKWLCAGCKEPLPGIDLPEIVLDYAPNYPLNIAFGIGVGVISKEFLEKLGNEFSESRFELRKLRTSKGTEIQKLLAFRSRSPRNIRGDKNSSYRKCNECGQPILFPAGERYVLPTTATLLVYETQLHTLLLLPEVYDRISIVRSSKLGMHKIPVRSKANDGLPDQL